MTGLEAFVVFCLFLVPLAFLVYLGVQAVDEREKRRKASGTPVDAVRRAGGA